MQSEPAGNPAADPEGEGSPGPESLATLADFASAKNSVPDPRQDSYSEGAITSKNSREPTATFRPYARPPQEMLPPAAVISSGPITEATPVLALPNHQEAPASNGYISSLHSSLV